MVGWQEASPLAIGETLLMPWIGTSPAQPVTDPVMETVAPTPVTGIYCMCHPLCPTPCLVTFICNLFIPLIYLLYVYCPRHLVILWGSWRRGKVEGEEEDITD